MKSRLQIWMALCVVAALLVSTDARGERQEYLLDKIKKLFVKSTPTPTPKPHKRKRKSTPTPTASPETGESPATSVSPTASPSPLASATPSPAPVATASPSATPSPRPTARRTPTATPTPSSTPTATAARSPSPTPSAWPTRAATAAPTPTPAPHATAAPLPPTAVNSPTAAGERPQLLEPVRPISPGPRTKFHVTTSPPPAESSPIPKAVAVPVGKPVAPPDATVSSSEVAGYENYPPDIRRIIDAALDLAKQGLSYKVGSADPASGGMDSSGFVYYVLTKSGIKDVPRDAREQYIWVRKAGTFQAVLAHRDDTFELDALKPGDLLFWASPSSVSRDPDITQTMLYLGREKATNQRIMIGASDVRSYKGQSRFGVSTFDFKVGQLGARSREAAAPVFVGYGHVPGLRVEQ